MPSRRVSPLLVLLALTIALVCADRASAVPPQCPPDCTPVVTQRTITHTLTVARPSAGTITSAPGGISCPAGSGGDCTQPDSQTVQCVDGDCADPDPDGWATYTLTASGGPSGFAPSWSGCGNPCSVTLDADRSVSLSWVDVTNPSVSVSPGSVKVGRTLNAGAAASDNAGVARVEFWLDGSLKATDTTAPYGASIPMDGYAQGSTHTLLARAYDTSGRVADSSSTVTVDKVVNLTVGALPAYTNAATVPLTIGTDPDATMKCALNGGTPAACTGSYSPVGAASPDGSYTYNVTATDDVGNVAAATRTFVLDRTAPAITDFDGPSEGGLVTTDAVTITYQAADANLATVTCTLDGAAVPCDADGASLNGLANGSHSFKVTAADEAGNSGSKVRTFSVSKVVHLTLGAVAAYTNAATVPLTIATDPDASMRCALNGGAATACAGTFSPVGATSPDGTYTYTVTAEDGVGNIASGTRTFVLDRTPPAIADFDPPIQLTTDAATITYHAVDANLDTVTCTLDGAALPCDAGRAALTELANGSHTFTVTATDKAGNTGSKSRSFSVQKAATGGATPTGGDAGTGGGTPTSGDPTPTGGGTTVIATPPLAANPAVVRYRFTRHGATTTFTRLSVAKLPAGAKVRATCHGRGCPKRAKSIRSFLKRKLRPGAVIRITISKPGMTTKTVKLTVRAHKDPKLG